MAWMLSWLDATLFLVTSLILLVYFYGKKDQDIFKKRGIKYSNPYPFIGNMLPLVLGKKHLNYIIQDAYNKFKNEKFFGLFFFMNPELVVKDLDLIKLITIKHFDHFTDHFLMPDEKDPLFFHNLFSLQGERWHNMRITLSPAFTSSKMRAMMPFVRECSERFNEHLKKQCEAALVKGNKYLEIEMKEVFNKFTNDVIASCAFGIQSDSLSDPNNEFFQMAYKMTNIDLKDALKLFFNKVFPFIKTIFNIKLMDDSVEKYYRRIVMDIIKQRTQSGVVRKDMIYLLMLAMQGTLHEDETPESQNVDSGENGEKYSKKNIKTNWTDDEITAQAVIFLFAGFETTSTLLSFMCYELAINTDAQALLMEEVDQYIRDSGGMIKYNDIPNLTYLDMVTSETLRLWPPGGTLDRVCVKPFTIPASNEPDYTIQKGEIISIPVFSIQNDSKYFPNAEKFIPERFAEENKSSFNAASFFPFGIGPRICIGNRFALMEVKVMMFYLLSEFEIIRTPKTQVPVRIKSHPFNLHSIGGFQLGLKKRQRPS